VAVSPRIALKAEVIIPGVPPAWTNERGHHMVLYARKEEWKQLAWTLGHSARNAAHWPPLDRVEPARRWIRFDVHRHRLLDADNVVASVKPILDGLKGVLLVDDNERWMGWLGVEQHRAPVASAERVVVSVFLADPR
jgi:hypothetical protein